VPAAGPAVTPAIRNVDLFALDGYRELLRRVAVFYA
jgi:hypothetical protein